MNISNSSEHQDIQLVEPILQLGAKKPLQKGTQWDDLIKRAPVKLQIMENHVENMMEI